MNLLRTKSLITLPSLGGRSHGGLSLAAIREQLAQQAGAVALYLPSTYARSVWRRYDATTEIGMVGYPVGFLGDRLQGMALGAELLTNGNFDSGTTGWLAAGASLSVDSGRLSVRNITDAASVGYQSKSVQIGRFFLMASALTSGTGVASRLAGTGSSFPNYSTPTNIIRSQAVTLYFYCRTSAGVNSVSYHDDCSLKEIVGNHSTQETDNLRPTLLFNGSVYYLSHAGGQKLTAYVPSSLGSACTIIYASPGVGAQVLPNVAVTSNAVDLSWNHSGLVILPSTATPEQVAIATAIMGQLAWRTVV